MQTSSFVDHIFDLVYRSSGEKPIQAHLSAPIRVCFKWRRGTQYPVTKLTSDDISLE